MLRGYIKQGGFRPVARFVRLVKAGWRFGQAL